MVRWMVWVVLLWSSHYSSSSAVVVVHLLAVPSCGRAPVRRVVTLAGRRRVLALRANILLGRLVRMQRLVVVWMMVRRGTNAIVFMATTAATRGGRRRPVVAVVRLRRLHTAHFRVRGPSPAAATTRRRS